MKAVVEQTKEVEEEEIVMIEIVLGTVPVGINSSSSQQWLKQ